MSSDPSQELSEEDNITMNFSHIFSYDFKNGISISFIPWLIVSVIFVLFIRCILRSMLNLCSSSSGGIHYMPRACAVEMIQYINPFVFKMNLSKASYAGVECTMHSTEDCYILPLWGVPIYTLFKFLHERNWTHLMKSICDNSFQNKCIGSNDHFLLHAGEELTKEFRPQHFCLKAIESLPIPRLNYAFVLMMVSKKLPTTGNPQLVMLANIIHIRDKVVQLPTQLTQQYVRSSDGTVAGIKNIYPGSFETSRHRNRTVELCLMCMHREIAVIIIPCGHACVCTACFELCENCPICRGPKNFYFISDTVSQH